MTKADKKIAELEKRVKELEARPPIVVMPAPVIMPLAPAYPYYPWYQTQITCNDGVSYIGNSQIVATWKIR